MNEMDKLLTGRIPDYKVDDDYLKTLSRPKALLFRITHGWSQEQLEDCVAPCRNTYDVFQSAMYGEDSGEYIDFDEIDQGDALMWMFMTACFVYPPNWALAHDNVDFAAVYGDQDGPEVLRKYAAGNDPPDGQWFVWRDMYWWLDTDRDKLQPAFAAMIPHMPDAKGQAEMQPMPDDEQRGGTA